MSAAPLRVLVVDDEPPIRKLLRMGLTAQGYQTLEAPNGKAALDLGLAEKLPDIAAVLLLRHMNVERFAGDDRPAKSGVVDAHKVNELAFRCLP